MSSEEELILWCRRLWERHLVMGTSGNVSIRLDDGDLLVTPSQRGLGYLACDDLVRVSADGRVLDGKRPTSELPLHLAAYRVRPEIAAVIHTHPTMSVVWSKTGSLFPRDTVGASESLGTCSWTPYRKNGTEELAELCAAEFARGVNVVVMERHGLTAVASSLEEAFMQTELAEEAARIAYYSSRE
ncbi:MAG TPA: class II aldolase/adducin family protein [Candidatus Aquilonibacter sp.]|nr:class II aldolase/adducin family protein [Candidatus Aquilonibacter sp.]